MPTPATMPARDPDPPEASSFDLEYARLVVRYIVEDIATADARMVDPSTTTTATMTFLAEDMDKLQDAGIPPVSDPARYLARVQVLGQFYAKAAVLLPDDAIGAVAAYMVAREDTSKLLAVLNPILGTHHKLPPWKFM
ncbi:hypothetical protein [Terrabacter sp. 2RAF25]|uniref:hypothetical protein n=1 Tax=Terrabacter sp. 2RAF25 TaxID=3232998 RepID=UPI003F94D7EA